MAKKKGVKRMNATAAKLYDFSKVKNNKTKPIKPFTKLSKEQVQQSMDFKRRSWERD